MTQPLHRTQVLLEPQQHQELTRIAKEEDRSLSDLLREMVRRDLERRRTEEDAELRARLTALERALENRDAIERRRGGPIDLDPAELIRQAREERDRESWEAVGGSRDHD